MGLIMEPPSPESPYTERHSTSQCVFRAHYFPQTRLHVFYMCVYVCVRAHACVMVHLWRSEGKSVELVFSFHLCMGPRN